MKRIDSLQSLRAIAFLAIFLSHCGITSTGPVGVSVFLVLSGFLMMYSYKSRNAEPEVRKAFSFMLRKMSKLYPLHILILIIILAGIKFGLIEGKFDMASVLCNALLVQAWIPNSKWYFSYNAVSWYLSVCVLLYLCFPVLFALIRKISDSETFIITATLIVVQVLLPIFIAEIYSGTNSKFYKWMTYIFPLYRLLDFFYGMVLARVILNDGDTKVKRNGLYHIGETILLFIWIGQVLVYTKGGILSAMYRYSFFWVATSLIAVALFYYNRGYITRLLTCRPVVFIGNISGVAFLLHTSVIFWVKRIGKIDGFILFIIAFCITIIISFLYNLIDKAIRNQLIAIGGKH